MVVLHLFLFFLWIVPLPLLIGAFGASQDTAHPGSFFLAWFYGIFTEFALFELLAIPMVFLKCSLKTLSFLWLLLSLLLAGISLYKSSFPSAQKFRQLLFSFKKRISPLLVIVLCCIFLQVLYVTFRQHIDEDDAFYVATAVTAAETDTLMEYNPYTGELYKSLPSRYVLSAWPLYLAVLSVLSGGLHPTLIAHLLLPGLIVLFAYLIYALIARDLFPGEPFKQDLFLLLVIFVLSFSGFSVYSSGTFLLIRGWQGKALIAGILQPALFFLCRRTMGKNGKRSSWFFLFCAVTSACMFSSMGVVLSIIPVGVYSLVYAIEQKHWRYLPWALLSCSSAIVCGGIYLILM